MAMSSVEQRLTPLGNTFISDTLMIDKPGASVRAHSYSGYVPHRLRDLSVNVQELRVFAKALTGLSNGKVACSAVIGLSWDTDSMQSSIRLNSLCFDDTTDGSRAGSPASSKGHSGGLLVVRSAGRKVAGESCGSGVAAAPTSKQAIASVRRATAGEKQGAAYKNRDIKINTTTLMIKNLPLNLMQEALVAKLDNEGFRGQYDFLYMPATFGTCQGKGYAFVNFLTPGAARELFNSWHRARPFGLDGSIVNISAAEVQGRSENAALWDKPTIRRIRNPNFRPLVLLPADAVASQTATP